MPLHDYFCPTCGVVLTDQYRTIEQGAQSSPPIHCEKPAEWIPAVQMIDAKEPFQTFEVYDGANNRVNVGSLHQMRQIERESEQLERNGEGAKMTFRMWSQDRSNKDVNTHGTVPHQTPDPAYVKKFGKTTRSVEAPDRAFGPGVHEGNTSALGNS